MSFTFDDRRNWAHSTVATLVGNTLTVALGEGTRFPSAPFNATCVPTGVVPTSDNAEIVRITGKSGDIFTIVRAQEGTITKGILAGWVIAAGPTDKFGDDLESAINTLARKVDLSVWFPVPNVLDWNAASSGAGVLAVGGLGGTIYRSDNGPLWIQATTPSSTPTWYGACYGGGKHVFVGSGSSSQNIVWSVNAIGFTAASGMGSVTKRAVCFGNSLYVVCGDSGVIYTASDPATWTVRTGVGSTALYGAAYGSSLYCLVGAGGKILTSANGIAWTQQTSNTSTTLRSVVWGPQGFMAVGDNGTVVTSVNGTAWVLKPQITSANFATALVIDSTYFAAGSTGAMFTTTDLTAYSQVSTGIHYTNSFDGDIRALAASPTVLTFAGSSGCHRYTTIA